MPELINVSCAHLHYWPSVQGLTYYVFKSLQEWEAIFSVFLTHREKIFSVLECCLLMHKSWKMN